MTGLREKIIELTNMENELVILRKEIQRRIGNGESSGRIAVDYALAAGIPRDEKTLAEIEAFHDRLKGRAGEPVLVILADRRRPSGQRLVKEARMGVLHGDPWFHFGENMSGWKLCARFATCSEDGDVFIVEAPMFFSSTNGLLQPNVTHHAVEGIWIGAAEVNGYLRNQSPTFNADRLSGLSSALGLPHPTTVLTRTNTMRGI